MLLYHFTSRENLPGIMAEGLTRGEVPLSDTRTLNAVNLTTDPNPQGHGLDAGGKVITEEGRQRWFAVSGQMLPENTVFANKLEVRITVKLPSSDRHLERWLPWARKRLTQDYLTRLIQAGGGGMRTAKTWWLYWGVIPPSQFVGVTELGSGQ